MYTTQYSNTLRRVVRELLAYSRNFFFSATIEGLPALTVIPEDPLTANSGFFVSENSRTSRDFRMSIQSTDSLWAKGAWAVDYHGRMVGIRSKNAWRYDIVGATRKFHADVDMARAEIADVIDLTEAILWGAIQANSMNLRNGILWESDDLTANLGLWNDNALPQHLRIMFNTVDENYEILFDSALSLLPEIQVSQTLDRYEDIYGDHLYGP